MKGEALLRVLRAPSFSSDSPPRVLLVGTHLSARAFNHSVGEDLAERLSRDDWTVIMTSASTSRFGRISDMLYTTWSRRTDYDVALVDVYSGWAFRWAEAVTWLLRALGKPYVVTLHGGNLPRYARNHADRVRRVLRGAVTATTPSRYLLEQMRGFREDLVELPNPIDVDRFSFRVRRPARPKIVWLRAFQELYNPGLAVEVVARLIGAFPDLHLTMVGPDKDGTLERVRNTVRALGLDAHIGFRGGVPHDRIPACFDAGDIFLNTSNVDNTPVSVLEAMASGLCVVSTNAGGLPYMLRDGHDALLVPRDHPDLMAHAVQRILREPELAERLSRNARSSAERCGWTLVLPAWKSLLSAAAAAPRRLETVI